jgi:hypothetical protein
MEDYFLFCIVFGAAVEELVEELHLFEWNYIQSAQFVDLQQHMPSVLRFADLLAVLPQSRLQAAPRLRADLLHQALDDVVAELVLGEGDEAG